MRPKIILTMMCANEGAVIERALLSIKPFLSHYMILDNGSTDDTCDIIREVFKDLPGELHEGIEWKGHGQNRTEVHDYARRYLKENGIEDAYHAVIDCDETLEWDGNIITYENHVPAYWAALRDGNSIDSKDEHSQPRAFLLSDKYEWEWQWSEHHRLVTRCGTWPDEIGKNDKPMANCSIIHHADGFTWKDPETGASKIVEKYARKANNIEREIIVAPHADRYFSLAKSYQMAMFSNDEKTHQTYKTRAIDALEWVCHLEDSSEQEIYHCLCELAKLKDDPQLMMAAYEFRPQRPDAPYELAQAFEHTDRLHLAAAWYLITENVSKNHPYCGDTVFHNIAIKSKVKGDRARIKEKLREEANKLVREERQRVDTTT